MYRYLSLLPLFFLFYSCSTLAEENIIENTEPTPKIIIQKTSVNQGINEFTAMLNLFDETKSSIERDIDNKDWLIYQINYWADRDQIAVQRIYEDLKYRNWNDNEKQEYLNHALLKLVEDREILLEDLAYLIKNSLLLKEMPWMVRDFYDERTEFSYWYLIYMGRSIYPFWLDEIVLPAMLRLIPQDRITAVTYLWMKNQENLITMKQEIYYAGYPWSRLIYLIKMNDYVSSEIESLLTSPDIKNAVLPGNLI